jgi:hypothetical protein
MKRTESVLITEGMVASLCIAVMIKRIIKHRVRVRDFSGWDCYVKSDYIQPLTKSFPPDFDESPRISTTYGQQKSKCLSKNEV